MKRIIILLALALPLSVNAQPNQGQKMIHLIANRIARQIEVAEPDRDTFINLYRNYKKESSEIMKIQPESFTEPEKAAEARILCDFEKSEKILSLRKQYYYKFRQIISPVQIQEMYNSERSIAGTAQAQRRE